MLRDGRWESEELDRIYHVAPMGLCLTDLNCSYIRINDRLAAMNGVPVSDHIGRTIHEIIPRLAPTIESLAKQVMESREPVLHHEIRGYTPSGPGIERCWLTSFYPLTAPDGTVDAISIMVLEDFEGRRTEGALWMTFDDLVSRLQARVAEFEQENARLTIELRRLREQLEHLRWAAMMGKLATAVACAVTQPLTAMVASAQAGRRLAAQGAPDDEVLRDLMSDIMSYGERAGEAIHRMRALLQRRGLERAPLDVNPMVERVAALFRSQVDQDAIMLTLDLATGRPRVMGDSILLQQVVLDLLEHGADAMAEIPVASRRIVLTTSMLQSGEVEVAVRVSGVAADPDLIDRVFEPFFTIRPDGNGMRLAIDRTIIEAHRGALWATPDTDSGTTLRFSLPAMEDELL